MLQQTGAHDSSRRSQSSQHRDPIAIRSPPGFPSQISSSTHPPAAASAAQYVQPSSEPSSQFPRSITG
ncbi:hypothetical protein Mapa_001113 [Marchantia paleacea]|nr:hypothetical protein Mapa_001113 [Marchantia paleacea]